MFDSPSTTSSSAGGSFMGGLSGAMGDAMGYAKAAPELPNTPASPGQPPMFGAQGTTAGKKAGGRKPSASFIGGAALVPTQSNLGTNTLLGQ